MSLHIAKLFSRPLALAAVALVIHVGTATAADSTGDTQQQMKELLTGTTTPAHSTPQSGCGNAVVYMRPCAYSSVLGGRVIGCPYTATHRSHIFDRRPSSSGVAASFQLARDTD